MRKYHLARTFALLVVAALPAVGAPLPGDGFVDFEAGNDGDTATTTVLANGSHNLAGLGTGTAWQIVDDGTKLTASTAAKYPLDFSVVAGGTTYATPGTRGLKSSWGANNHAQLNLGARYPFLSVGFHFKLSAVSSTHDLFNLKDGTRGVYNVLQVSGDHVHLHCNAVDPYNTSGWSITPIYLVPNHWYWITMQFGGGGNTTGAVLANGQWSGAPAIGKLNVYDAEAGYSLVQKNTYLMPAGTYSDYAVSQIWVGALKYSTSSTDWSYYDNLVVSTSGVFPLLPSATTNALPAAPVNLNVTPQ